MKTIYKQKVVIKKEKLKYNLSKQIDECIPYVSQPHFGLSVRVKPTLPKVRTWNPPRLLKIQSSS
jgi:hypothetical protein